MNTHIFCEKCFVSILVAISITFSLQVSVHGAQLDVGEPRTVRMIYFLPKDRQYDAKVVQKMKNEMRAMQTFFAEQMQAHGYGNKTFRFETDNRGNPKVHRVDGKHTDKHYIANNGYWEEIHQKFDLERNNIYFIVWDNSTSIIAEGVGGTGSRRSKSVGKVLVPGNFSFGVAAHELGHAFGLGHDFRDRTYIMSYGHQSELSACAAEFLAVHPYFNPSVPLEEGLPPTIEVISPRTYSAGTKSVTIQIKVKDPDGVHQIFLFGAGDLIACQGLSGKKESIVEFEYDGVDSVEGYVRLSDAVSHGLGVHAVDKNGNMGWIEFNLSEISQDHIAELESGEFTSVAFSPDGNIIASGSRDGIVTLWDVETQRSIATFNGASVAFSPNGRILAMAGGNIHLWDVSTQKSIATLSRAASVLAFSPDGSMLASGSYDGEITLWDVETQRDIFTFEAHPRQSGLTLAFSPDGNMLASGSYDGMIKLWDVATGTNIASIREEGLAPYINSVAFSPDGTILASGRGNGPGNVKLWDVATRRNIGFFDHKIAVGSVAFSPDGNIIASGSRDGIVRLWHIATHTEIAAFPHTSGVWSVAFSPDGRTLASGTWDGTLNLWSIDVDITSLLSPDKVVSIPDTNLAKAIRQKIGNSITTHTLLRLTEFVANGREITDLTGLEHARNLKDLYLGGNTISDITPLAGLTQLTRLELPDNTVSDITPLTGLTQLKDLTLWGNAISDITPLAKLTQLTHLELEDNAISDITPLAGLTQLTRLELPDNTISDITPLAGLTKLFRLTLGDNTISDITPLAGLTRLRILYLSSNAISDITPLAKLTQLMDLSLAGNAISDITPLADLTQLTNLTLWGCQIRDISLLAKFTKLVNLHLSENKISDVRPLANLVNLKELHLYRNPIKNKRPLLALLRKNPDVKIYLKNDREPLPVTLSHFRAEHTDTGVIIKWITESEVNNAGFYIYRGETKDGDFKVVNPTMIQGAGTTGERNEYTWIDTTAKPNTVYYYQIEDVSHAGERKRYVTVRLRGLVSASGKWITRWADLKSQD